MPANPYIIEVIIAYIVKNNGVDLLNKDKKGATTIIIKNTREYIFCFCNNIAATKLILANNIYCQYLTLSLKWAISKNKTYDTQKNITDTKAYISLYFMFKNEKIPKQSEINKNEKILDVVKGIWIQIKTVDIERINRFKKSKDLLYSCFSFFSKYKVASAIKKHKIVRIQNVCCCGKFGVKYKGIQIDNNKKKTVQIQ